MRWLLLIFVFVVASVGSPAAAARPTHLAVSLHAQSETPAAGRSTRLALKFVPERGWHGYWSNPGDSGLPPKVSWKAPAGTRFGPLRHPAPSYLEVAGLASFVHSGTHVLLADMRVPAGLEPGTLLPIEAQLEWLACTDSLCVPERATLKLDLAVGDGAASASNSGLFRAASAALPRKLGDQGTFRVEGGRLVLRIPSSSLAAARTRFYPDLSGTLEVVGQRAARSSDGIEISIPAPERTPRLVSGVVSDGRRSFALNLAPAPAPAPASASPWNAVVAADAPTEEAAGETSLAADIAAGPAPTAAVQANSILGAEAGFMAAFLGALVGGILLNLMPCVFPVLSLKALSLARSGGSHSAPRRDALAYLAGTVAVCLLLGAVLLAARSAGVQIGWSFQLQSPAIILSLLLLVSAIAANLAGIFEVRGPTVNSMPSDDGPLPSFMTGALTAGIATPCSAPFMGAALGAALLLPPVESLAVFGGLGLGLGLPFVLIGFVPAIRKRLPRPGPWMETLQRLLAVPMMLTAVWLLWVLGSQAGVDAMAIATGLIVLAISGLWWIGRRQRAGRGRAWAPLAPLAAGMAVALVVLPVAETGASAARVETSERFSVERLAELRSAERPIFVDFTADWCLTCKVNERIAIDRPETHAAFEQAGVVTLVGDWTRGDPEITRFLAAHGRNSIPFYLFYEPGQKPQVLPQVLTPGMLQELAAQAGGEVRPTS